LTLRARWVTLRARWVTLKSSLGDAKRLLGVAQARAAGYDLALRRARALYSRQMYSPANNCYQFVSHCLNLLGYKGACASQPLCSIRSVLTLLSRSL
jgi:hypothetical protein